MDVMKRLEILWELNTTHDARPPGARAPPACVRVVVPRAAPGAMRKATLPRPGRGRLGSGRG